MKRAAMLLLLAPLAFQACVEAPDEDETLPDTVIIVEGETVYAVDQWGSRRALEYLKLPEVEKGDYICTAISRGLQSLITVTAKQYVTRIDFSLKAEQPLLRLDMPDLKEIRQARLGWAGQRLYILLEKGITGWLVVEADTLAGNMRFMTPPLNDLGPGLENPVSFDLAAGGHQAWVLYESGKVAAFNMYMDDLAEGVVAEFPPGASDLKVTEEGELYAAGTFGIVKTSGAGVMESIIDLPALKLMEIRDPDKHFIWALDRMDALLLVHVSSGEAFTVLKNPETATDLTSIDYHWIKNTRPVLADAAIQPPPYYALTTVAYLIELLDPDGDLADVTAVLEPDAASQDMFFIQSGNTAIQFNGQGNHATLNMSFFAGDEPGGATIRMEALSADGRVTRREDRITVE